VLFLFPAPNISIKVERKASSGSKAKKETLLNVDLSEATGPTQDQFYFTVDEMLSISSANTMCGTIPSVSLAQIDASRNYAVERPYTYNSEGAHTITVPEGFVYDRASIPLIFHPLISPDSVGNVAPLIHDYLYRHGGILPPNQITPRNKRFSRKEADDLFYEVMTKCRVKKWRRDAAYGAVRAGAGFAWRGQ